MKTYTVADLRKNTRQILNEAAMEPVLITRYDETFVLSKQKILVHESALEGAKELSSMTYEPESESEYKPKVIKKQGDVRAVVPGSCVHGAAKGFCRVPKCPNYKK